MQIHFSPRKQLRCPSLTALTLLIFSLVLSACTLVSGQQDEPAANAPVRYGTVEESRIVLMPPKKPLSPNTGMTTAALVGKTFDEIESALGRPESVRDEKPAVVYRYRATGCELKLIFFMDIERKQFRVLSYDIAATREESHDLQACLNEIASVKQPS